MNSKVLTYVALGVGFGVPVVQAAELQAVGTIDIPGDAMKAFDISYVDQSDGRYYFADRSNKSVDIIDTAHDRYVDRIGGFVGVVLKDGKPNNDMSGPDGVIVAEHQVWAGDGDSHVKIFDAETKKLVGDVNTGGKTRVDEMAFDPKDKILVVVNNAEDPPFATLISAHSEHKIIGKMSFPNATDGAEQPAYNAADDLFYVSIPEIGGDAKKGGVAVIDPHAGTLVKILPVEGCHPAGLAMGPDGNFLLGCTADGKEMPAKTIVMNAKSGDVVAAIDGLGGSDMVNYNAKNRQYYTASAKNPGGPVLGVIDATTNKLVQTIALPGGTPHSVTSSETTGKVYVPVGAQGGGDGKIHVFAPKG